MDHTALLQDDRLRGGTNARIAPSSSSSAESSLILESGPGELTCTNVNVKDCVLVLNGDGELTVYNSNKTEELLHLFLRDVTSVYLRKKGGRRMTRRDTGDSDLQPFGYVVQEDEIDDNDEQELVIVSFPLATPPGCCHACCCCCCNAYVSRELAEDIILRGEAELLHHWEYAIMSQVSGREKFDLCVTTPKKFLVIISPTSGKGQAVELYETYCRPVFESSRVQCTVVVTRRACEATDLIIRQEKLCLFDGIVIVGGDGMIFEVIQGMKTHEQHKLDAHLPLPIGVIPCGSGNGIWASLYHITNEPVRDIVSAAVGIARGRTTDLDLWTVTTVCRDGIAGPRCFACLSLSWAIISDIDVESEAYRCLGGARFSLGAVFRVCCLRKYRAVLHYLPIENENQEEINSVFEDVPSTWRTVEGDFALLWAMNTTHATADCHAAPNASLSSGEIELMIVQDVGRIDIARGLLALDDGNHVDSPGWETIKTRSFRLEAEGYNKSLPGRLAVDGELLDEPIAKIQVESSKAAARFFSYLE